MSEPETATDVAGTEVVDADDADGPLAQAPVEPAPPRTEAPAVPEIAPATLHDLEPVTEPVAAVAPAPHVSWQRSDDDIVPTGRAARGGVRLPKARAGKAPKAPKGETGPKSEAAPKRERKGLKGLASMELSFGKKKK
ncbi:MAG: hypothetical protein QOJ09_735, partial [Actinomycetota bacterium]|nr:hypothetical protein [Actinomycetota bacterium]